MPIWLLGGDRMKLLSMKLLAHLLGWIGLPQIKKKKNIKWYVFFV